MKFGFFTDTLETQFWSYFESKVDELEKLSHPTDIQKVIAGKLTELFPGLGFGSLRTFKNGKKVSSIYITAYGDKSKFPIITKLVDKAPKRFIVTAFNPPSYLHDTLTFNSKSIPTDQIEFCFKKNNQELDITVYLPTKPLPTDNEFEVAFQELLLESLGEFQFAKLGFVDITSIDKKTPNQQTERLKELYRVLTTELKE